MSRLLITGLHSQSDEILAQIFLEHVEWATEDITHTSEGPWVPSHVCRSWRTIALAHPELWSTIRVEGPDNDDCDSEDELDLDPDASDSEDSGFSGTELGRPPKALFLLDLALERSQDHPLEVTLEFGMVEDTENGMAAVMRRMGEEAPSAKALNQKLIRAVVAHSNRWKTAELQITNALIPLFAPISNRLSLLTKLTIWTFEESPAPFPWARHAPRHGGPSDTSRRRCCFRGVALPLTQRRGT
ncbi:hypothetical protein C8R44DRAFT_814296 [Mycena epipterygia]|nr:hypothetical protein C8R44DRAFT_814296 [Mycena epipterygia]